MSNRLCQVCGKEIPNSEKKYSAKYCDTCREEQARIKRNIAQKAKYIKKSLGTVKLCKYCGVALPNRKMACCDACRVTRFLRNEDLEGLREQKIIRERMRAVKLATAAKAKAEKNEIEKRERKRLKFTKQCEGCGHWRPIAADYDCVCHYILDTGESKKKYIKGGKCQAYTTEKFKDIDCYKPIEKEQGAE